MSPQRRKPKLGRRTTGGGGAGNVNSLANLRRGGPPAPLGNRRTVTHGAYAAVAAAELEAKTLVIFEALAADAPVQENGSLPRHDTLVVRMLAEVMVRRERVRIEELRHGFEAKDGKLRGVVEYGLRLDGQALELAKELGMTPLSRARLGLDLRRAQQIDVAQAMSDLPDDETIDGTAAEENES